VVDRDAFLAERRIAVLATDDADGSAYLTAVWFLWEDGAFLVPTGAGSRKGRNARERARGAILVDARGERLCGVAASGRLEVIEGEAAVELNHRIHRRYVTAAGMDDPALGGLLVEADDVTLRLAPERWQEWDMEPVFGPRLSDPRLVEPLAR
jgi:nitroimidazol reductase NimA-like FMN-containing flavoprotein (pyridoxamine 5'-phosphate oxidase superfamily)